MSPDKLVYMVNQIGKFFVHEPEDRAVADITDHIAKYWDPRMRKAIMAHVAESGAGLDPLPLRAVRALKPVAERR